MSTSKYLNGNGLSEAWTNTKNYIAAQLLGKSDVGHTHNYAGSSNAGGAASSTLKLETYKQGSTTETYGANYPIFAQWVDGSNVALKCTNYTVCVDKANSVAWGNVSGKPSFATVATSGSYNDLSNKPTIPTVNNATLTIQKNGSNVATFTSNASSNVTCNITVPTKTSDLTNDNRYASCLNNNSINFDWYSTYPGKVGIKVDNTWVGGIDTIEEQGNGYIRYSNGIQICWGSITWQSECSNPWGSLYETTVITMSYAKSFVELPAISISGDIGGSSAIIESNAGSNTMTPNIYLCRATAIDTVLTCTACYIAIGRWK